MLAEGGDEAGQGLRRALCACRDPEVVAAAQARADLQRRRHAAGGEDVPVGVGVSPELDLLRHPCDASSE
jgi:hypothetical protein